MRTRCRGRAVTSSRRPERWWGWPPVTVTRARAPGPGLADSVDAGWKVHHLPLTGPPGEGGLVPTAHAFDEHFLAPPHPGLVASQGGAVDDRLETVEALGHHVGRHERRGQRRGPRPGARREDEGEGAVVGRFRTYRERVLEVALGLSREPDDDVGRHRQVADGRPRVGQASEVALRGVAAPHGAQYRIASRLQRQV